jgi:ubiquinone/menaquinone biosynthesis C-methylase UbiE
MLTRDKNLPENSVISGKLSTIEEARDYDKSRFTRRYRMRRLDRFEKAFAQKLLDMTGEQSHILDIPCGNGRFFNIFSKAAKLIMADYSLNMLQAVEERFSSIENLELIQADITSLPLDDSSVDLCFCMRLFHHMKNDQVRLKALKELARVSRRYVALSFYNKHCLRFYWRKILRKKIRGNYVTFKHLEDIAKQAGLKVTGRFPRMNLTEQQCLLIFEKK